MSRLGDLIRLERTRRKLTCKQVAKQCGISEKYLQDVEWICSPCASFFFVVSVNSRFLDWEVCWEG